MAARRPNILLITTDTQRWDTLKCMGNPHAVSPNLDRLAAEGVLFTQGHTSSPVCMPARCSLLTGVHTPVHGCIENGIDRREDLPVFMDYLKEQGYATIMVGKTHFGPVPASFDQQYIIHGEKGSDKDDFYAEHIRRLGYSRSSSHPNPIPEESFMDAYIADTTMECIERTRGSGAPFFAFCSMLSPHGPIDPPGKWAHLYDGVPLPEINYRDGEIREQPMHLRRLVGTADRQSGAADAGAAAGTADSTGRAPGTAAAAGGGGRTPADGAGVGVGAAVAGGGGAASAAARDFSYLEKEGPFSKLNEALGNTIDGVNRQEIDAFRRLYYGSAAYCDHQVGRLMDYLERKGLRENTLIIFSSDHGQEYFDHGFNDKHNYYDASWRVPFIMSMPGTLPSGTKRDFAIWNDIPTTILAAAGTECPSMQGFDLFTPLAEGKPSPRRCAVATLFKSAALATEKWKLEYYFEEGTGRLYDRTADPAEQRNLYDDPAYAGTAAGLTRALLTWRSDLCDVNYLRAKTRGGGPVANRLAAYNKGIRGTDGEERLNGMAIRWEK